MEKTSELKTTPVNNSIYETYGDRWYTADDDPVALLRAESRTKTPWVLERISERFSFNKGTHVLDVGCGGGLLSNELAKTGLHVTGVDVAEDSLKVARKYDSTGSVNYIAADAYQLPFADESFHVVTAMDFLEHVEDPQKVIQEISRVLKPGGLFVFHTFNRNMLSYLVIIKFVEWFVKNTPKHMHVLRLFVKPAEVEKYCKNASMEVTKMVGIKPVFSSIPLKAIFTGVVPKTMKFEITKNLMLSYIGTAEKESKSSGRASH